MRRKFLIVRGLLVFAGLILVLVGEFPDRMPLDGPAGIPCEFSPVA